MESSIVEHCVNEGVDIDLLRKFISENITAAKAVRDAKLPILQPIQICEEERVITNAQLFLLVLRK